LEISVFLADPRSSCHFPPEYLQKVKQVHSKGGYGSQGYGYDWKIEEAEKNLLRTHTTAVSARMLYLLAREVSIIFTTFSLYIQSISESDVQIIWN
jgi:phenylalanyl-tRNA synthetase alpha subunit